MWERKERIAQLCRRSLLVDFCGIYLYDDHGKHLFGPRRIGSLVKLFFFLRKNNTTSPVFGIVVPFLRYHTADSRRSACQHVVLNHIGWLSN